MLPSIIVSTIQLNSFPFFYFFQIRNIVTTEGPRGLFRGLIPTWCREIPGYFCFFLGYEGSRSVSADRGI